MPGASDLTLISGADVPLGSRDIISSSVKRRSTNEHELTRMKAETQRPESASTHFLFVFIRVHSWTTILLFAGKCAVVFLAHHPQPVARLDGVEQLAIEDHFFPLFLCLGFLQRLFPPLDFW